MWQKIQTAIEAIYPPRCLGCGDLVTSDFGLCGTCWRDTPFIEGTVCESCGVPLIGATDGHRIECDDCMIHPRPWKDGRAALLYTGRARRIILALKHGDRPELARPAGLWMARAAKPILRDRMIIAPVPLHWTRLARRRYNQSALLAQSVGHATGLPVCPDLLVRSVATPMLEGMNAAQREALLTGAIKAHPRRKHRLIARNVLLVDDVMTSGATFAACARACLDAGANQVFVLALARVAHDT
ncbi:ComF family protein [Ruegeria aquimaris]|uniref:ComF family protein n=1 Tax=Ruegeria aquimaris TaxID=2984333 RepID=A0ABT3ARM1_9RHOB|nr:ComF family protein [Ruegeria sp. XHP0148]MCV2891336.1 ComF family protein [Ruegeria sp. XHP0148]